MEWNDRLSNMPETKLLDNVKSYEAVVLDVIKRSNKYFVILDQTGLRKGDTGIIYCEYKNIKIRNVISRNNIILHITTNPPEKGDIVRVEK